MVNLLAEYPQLNFHFPATGAADEFQSSLQEYRQESILLLHESRTTIKGNSVTCQTVYHP
jgi:hypothetical protein